MTKAATEKDKQFSAYRTLAQQREAHDPAWLVNLRAKAAERFEALDFPTTRDEAWKYTSVAPILKTAWRQPLALEPAGLSLATLTPFTYAEARRSQLVFVNGHFAPEFSATIALPAGVTVGSLAQLPAETSKLVSRHLATQADYLDHTFTALNTANLHDGALIHIPRGQAVETPIHLLFVSTENALSHPRVLIVAEENSIATVIESYVSLHQGASFSNAVTEVVTEAGAVLDHYRVQRESERAFHIGTTQVVQERGSRYASYVISLGAAIARHDLNIRLNDERTETEMDGLYVVTGNQHCDHHSTIDHAFPHCASKQLYKGILDDGARAVFNGVVYVREGAVQTDAKQLNKNLLLSPAAHVDTKPQLEIFADDVKCAHGATVGQLEDEQLFYLAARGISTERARALLTYGFAEDVISKIKIASVHKALDHAVLEKLHQNLEVD